MQDRFFGWNAVDYLGLRAGDRARRRLEGFHTANGMDLVKIRPFWMTKVDGLPA